VAQRSPRSSVRNQEVSATSGVVLSTLRQAADLDFRLTVFPRQAEVLTVDAWIVVARPGGGQAVRTSQQA
jgi:hypothetical protein